MATYLRLFDPTQQFQLKNGALNVSGRLYVYLEGTDDYADLYDENGSQLQQPVVLDNNGRSAGLFVDSKKTYWMKVNDQYDGTIFTIRKMTPCGGGGGSVLAGTYDVVSTDGSIAIDKSVDAGNTTFDLTKPSDSTELLEWFRSDSYYRLPDTNIYRPSCTKGTMETGDVGVQILANQYYHVTGHIWASKDEGREPFYDEITVKYMLRGVGLYDQLVMSSKVIVDYSLGLSQEFEVSTDVIPDEDCELYVVIENQSVNNGYFGLKDMEIHRICSGSPSIPSGVLSRARAAEIYQRKLIAGQNITITETEEGDIIASTGGGGGGGGATYQGGDGIIVNNTTYRISIDNSVVQEKLTAGENIIIDDNNVISATVPPVDISGKADKVEDAVSGNLAGLDSNGNLTDSGIAADRVVTDPSYVHTDNNFTTELKNKLVNIEAGAQANVQADWLESDSSSDAFIKNKPNIPAGVIVDQVYDATSANAQSGTAVAEAVAGVNAVPSSTSSDENKVLTVDSAGNPVWATAQGGSSDIFIADTTSTNEDVFQAYLAGKVLFYKDATNGIYNLTRTSESTSAGYINTTFSGYRASNVNVAEFANVTVFSVTIQSQNGHANSNLFSASITNKYVRVLNMPLLNGNAGKVLTVNSGATAAEWAAAPNGLPASTSADEDKVLTVDSNGDPTWATSQAQVQSNWTEADSSEVSYIQNKPTEINLIAGTGISLTRTAQGLVISLA